MRTQEGGLMESNFAALQDLNQWGSNEQFFRGFHKAKEKGCEEAFLSFAEVDEENRSYALDPENIYCITTEEMYFSLGRNISIVKHPRYFPVFVHSHAFFEIVYVLSGTCQQTISGKTFTLQEGDYCMIAPGIRHAISVFEDNSIVINILIRKSTFMDIFFNTIRDKTQVALFFMGTIYEKNRIEYLIFHTGNDEQIRNYVLEMYTEQMGYDDYSDRIMCSLMTIFFSQLTRKYSNTVERKDHAEGHEEYRENVMNYILNNYDTVSIKSLADHFHFSQPYCSKIVKDISGRTFSELLATIRMQQAENMLLYTQLSVENISERIGYANPESFIRSFKKKHGTSPSQFRKTAPQ